MKKEVSNSMSIENDPVFDVIIPLCSVCLNSLDGNICKVKSSKDLDCKYGKKYKCKGFVPDTKDRFYKFVKDKIENI